MERSLTVRAFGIPDNKEKGAMLHGINEEKNFYYSLALVNGDGQNFKNVDNNFDFMGRALGRAVVVPGRGPAARRHGRRLVLDRQPQHHAASRRPDDAGRAHDLQHASFSTTLAGVTAADTAQLNQQGRMNAFAFEVNAPVAHKCGLRWEFV